MNTAIYDTALLLVAQANELAVSQKPDANMLEVMGVAYSILNHAVQEYSLYGIKQLPDSGQGEGQKSTKGGSRPLQKARKQGWKSKSQKGVRPPKALIPATLPRRDEQESGNTQAQ